MKRLIVKKVQQDCFYDNEEHTPECIRFTTTYIISKINNILAIYIRKEHQGLTKGCFEDVDFEAELPLVIRREMKCKRLKK